MKTLPEQNKNQKQINNKVAIAVDIIISIVIVNYMTRDYLRACLKSIFREHDTKYQIIVVDNRSTDGSVEMVEEDFPSVHLIKNEKNVGFAKANNIAIKHAIGKYILLLNPDTELTGSTLEKLLEFMEKSPDVSATGCKVLYPDGRVQVSCGYFPTFSSAFWGGQTINILYRKVFPNRNFFGACGISPDALYTRQEVEVLLGACVILRKSVLEKVGLFDENMFMYFEECDLFYRIKRTGGKIMYIPDTTIIHHSGGSSNNCINKAVMYYQKSLEYYLRKNFSLNNIIFFKMAIMSSAIIKTTLLSLAYPFSKKSKSMELRTRITWYWCTFLYQLKMLFLS